MTAHTGFTIGHWAIVAVIFAIGCEQRAESLAASDVSTSDQASGPLLSPWTKSDDGKLQLRITVSTSRLKADATIPLQVEIQNVSTEPLTILKPFADWYHDQSSGVELEGPEGKGKYIGPIPSYELGEDSFVALAPEESTGASYEVHPSNYEGADKPGEYRLVYRYSADDGHKQFAEDRKVGMIWTGEMRSDALLFTRGDVPSVRGPSGGEPEENIEIVFPKGGYRFSLAKAAGGVKLKYDIVVKKDLPGIVYLPQDAGQAMGPGPSGLAPFEEIHGNGQSYAERDIGLGPGPSPLAKTIKKGTYATTIDWDGRNWTGPSDTSMPKGKAFPAGSYQLTVTMIGNVDTPKGRRFYRIQRSAPVELTE